MMAEHLSTDNDVIDLSRSGDGGSGARITNMSCDISDARSVSQAIGEVLSRHKKIDVLINNAGVLQSVPLLLMSETDMMSMVMTNLVGPMIMTKRVLRAMVHQRAGRVVNIISMSHKLCKPGDSVYGATKAGLEVFAKTVNAEVHGAGITVNNLAISASPTGMLEQIAKDNPSKIKSLIPHGDFADFESIMETIDFFCSPNSADIGGQTVFLGGI